MGLLKGLWNGLGDLYDSVDNTSEDNFNNYNRRQGSPKVRVSWRGNYKSTAGYWCSADVDEELEVIATSLNDLESRKANKLEDLDGIKLKKITQSDYDDLVSSGATDSNTLYIITD